MCASMRSTPTTGRTTWRASSAARPDGVLLPKARSGEDVHKLSIALHHAEERSGVPDGRDAHHRASSPRRRSRCCKLHTYVGSSARLEGLTWGAEDLSAVLGARTNREEDGRTWTSPYRLARDLSLFTAAAASVQAIDTVFVNFRDEEGLRLECHAAVRDGFTGKMAIHPDQVAVINEVFTPSADEVAAVAGDRAAVRRQPNAGALATAARWWTRRTWPAPSASSPAPGRPGGSSVVIEKSGHHRRPGRNPSTIAFIR